MNIQLKREAPISIYPPVVLYNKDDIKKIWDIPKQDDLEEQRANLYVHIPFCSQKCEFCYFTSFPAGNSVVQKYLAALKKEVTMLAQNEIVKKKVFHTIYFGGGTPTYLRSEQLASLIHTIRSSLNIAKNCEFCVEVRPGKEATQKKLQMLFELGVNRISMGAQSFVQEILDLNGRRQTIEEFHKVYHLLRKVGFCNINIDLMSGMIGDTNETWEESINTVLALNPENITVYKMCIYKSSELYKKFVCNNQEDVFVSDETEVERIKYFYERMHAAGYMESSNPYTFTKSNDYDHTYRMSRTSGMDLLGIGLSSNSYFNRVVFQNVHDLNEYIERIENHILPIENGYQLSEPEVMKRALIFALKTTRIDRRHFKKCYGKDPYIEYQRQFDRMGKDGLIAIGQEDIRLIGDAILYTDDIVRNYMFDDREKQMEKLLVMHKNISMKL